jgi:hypothetical protein
VVLSLQDLTHFRQLTNSNAFVGNTQGVDFQAETESLTSLLDLHFHCNPVVQISPQKELHFQAVTGEKDNSVSQHIYFYMLSLLDEKIHEFSSTN